MRVGLKFQTFEGDNRVIYRIVRFSNQDKIKIMNVETKEVKTVTSSDLRSSKYVEIYNDAVINFVKTSTSKNPEENIDDVYIFVHKLSDISADNGMPAMITRQNCYSYHKNQFGFIDGAVYMGDTITTIDKSQYGSIEEICEFSTIDYGFEIDAYIDDTIDSIMELLDHNSNKIMTINLTLRNIKKILSSNIISVKGLCSDIRELMENNNFMFYYRQIFNINTIGWSIILGKESYDEEGNIVLNPKQIKALEDELGLYISDVIVLEYDYDIDISSKIAMDHVLISDNTGKIFFVAYNKVGMYPVDDDIAKAFGLGK